MGVGRKCECGNMEEMQLVGGCLRWGVRHEDQGCCRREVSWSLEMGHQAQVQMLGLYL